MEQDNNQYHFSFFKPTTDSARRNRNMVVQFVLIWAVAIFGFQILLKILEKPTPEVAYLNYEKHWQAIKSDNWNSTDLVVTGQSALSLLGKVGITPVYREALDNAVSWMAYNIADSTSRVDLVTSVGKFESIAAEITDISDSNYLLEKSHLGSVLREIFELQTNDVRSKIAPLEIKSSLMNSFKEENLVLIEEAMAKYLIHNRSVLTDTKFLGFPFHYFYTAFFLLVGFVGLCLLYCLRTDTFNRKYGVTD